MTTRPAVLAGRWYPADADGCVDQLDAAPPCDVALPDQAFGAIVPHAGWVYSGALAYETLRQLHARRGDADLVVVFGGHLGPRHPPRLLMEERFETPFGPMPIAETLAQDIAMAVECDIETAEEFYDDNAVEVLLPMVRRLWPHAALITLGVPPTDRAASTGREVLDLARRRGFQRVAVVGSTDLTHYGPNYDFQPQGRGHVGLEWVKTTNDPEVIEHITHLDARQVLASARRHQNACCPGAVNAALGATLDLGATRGALAGYTTSWDVRADTPNPTSFVGYAGLLLGA